MEKDAFKELEEAMISASMPKKDRLKIMCEVGSIPDSASGMRD